MKQYVKHEAKWDANNPVAIFSRERLNRGCLKISAAICIGGGKINEGDLLESNYLSTDTIKVYKVTSIERFTPKGHWIIPNENIGVIANLEPFIGNIEDYLYNASN